MGKIIETAYGQPGYIYNPESNSRIPEKGVDVPANATSFVTYFSQLAFGGAKMYIYDDRPYQVNNNWPNQGRGKFELNVYGEVEDKEGLFTFLNIQAGSNAG